MKNLSGMQTYTKILLVNTTVIYNHIHIYYFEYNTALIEITALSNVYMHSIVFRTKSTYFQSLHLPDKYSHMFFRQTSLESTTYTQHGYKLDTAGLRYFM